MRRKFKPLLALGGLSIALTFSSCAPRPIVHPETGTPAVPTPAPVINQEAHHLMVFIPVTDNDAVTALKLLERSPSLRMVIAMSPRFQRFAKEQTLKDLTSRLVASKRLDVALQLPNAPLIPLLMDTSSAKDSLPTGSQLPDPAFAYPDDVIQIVARAKTDFFHTWKVLPHGMVLPYGAASPDVFALFERLGFNWIIAALGAAPVGGPYLSGALQIWDGTPNGDVKGTDVLVCDERVAGSDKALQTLNQWAKSSTTASSDSLPSDNSVTPQPLPLATAWARRTWNNSDWSMGIGQSRKNAAWGWLRKTREDLEVYKNSGRASVQRLDLAFEEIYTAENFNYFIAIGNDRLPTGATEDREHEFQATLSSVYRLIGQNPPDDLFSDDSSGSGSVTHVSSTTVLAESLTDGNIHLSFGDPAGDDRGDGKLPNPPTVGSAGSYDLRQFEVWTTSQSLIFSVTLGAGGAPTLTDIYMDLNGQPNLGTVTMLPGRGLTSAASDAWEYAISFSGTQAVLYKTLTEGTYEQIGTFPLITDRNQLKVLLPRSTIHGNPKNWGYQVLVMALDPAASPSSPMPWSKAGSKAPPIYDLLDPLEVPQAQLLSDIESGVRSDVPFVRVQK